VTHPLVQPLALPCGVTLSNRLCKAAMSEGMADLNNNATPRLEALYGGGGYPAPDCCSRAISRSIPTTWNGR
jgi:hypothetical protein